MKKNKTNTNKQKIYKRNFLAFLVIYLILMIGFGAFLLSQQKKLVMVQFATLDLQINQHIKEILQDDIDSNNLITDIGKVKNELVNDPFLFTYLGAETAIYSDEFDLIYNTNSYWICNYPQSKENTNYSVHSYINPKRWFSEEEIAQIEYYLYMQPKVKKIGDLSSYSVDVEGFWVEDEEIIPNKIKVIEMFATSLNHRGGVLSSSGIDNNDIVFESNYVDRKELPYYTGAHIQPNQEGDPNSELKKDLRQMVLDKNRLKIAVEKLNLQSLERHHMFKYRYYNIMPYGNNIDITNNQNHSNFWTVISREVNIWDRCSGPLGFVGLTSLIIFILTAFILSSQTYRIYQKREALETQRRDTTSALAHDLKTPLSIISGYAQNLIENIQSEKRVYYAECIQSNVNRMDQIIREMLELSKLEMGSIMLKNEDVSLGELGTKIIERYQQVCDEKLITAYLEGDAIIQVDRVLMERAIDNFFINALNHTPEGGTISIQTHETTFEIYNSGSFIPEDHLECIWLPYKKVDMSRGDSKGTGLGLAITRTIFELYGFTYGVRNEEDGVRFWFKWNAESK